MRHVWHHVLPEIFHFNNLRLNNPCSVKVHVARLGDALRRPGPDKSVVRWRDDGSLTGLMLTTVDRDRLACRMDAGGHFRSPMANVANAALLATPGDTSGRGGIAVESMEFANELCLSGFVGV